MADPLLRRIDPDQIADARVNPAVMRRLIGAWFADRRQFARTWLARTCPICGYHGIFIGVGHPPRWDARCLQCGSRERHRLMHLWVTEGGGNRLAGRRILHFAPEKTVLRQMRGNPPTRARTCTRRA